MILQTQINLRNDEHALYCDIIKEHLSDISDTLMESPNFVYFLELSDIFWTHSPDDKQGCKQ